MSATAIETKIIKKAQKLFIQKGFAETSMSDIAEALKINRPTLYYYFRTKEKLFDQVFGTIIHKSIEQINLILSEEIPLSERLSKIIDSYFDHFTKFPDLPMFVFREIQRNPAGLIKETYESKIQELFKGVYELYTTYVKDKQLEGVSFTSFLMSFYSLLVSPFVFRKLLSSPYLTKDFNFTAHLKEWKNVMMLQLTSLLNLQPGD